MAERKPRARRKARKPKQRGDFIRVGTLDELKRKRMKVVSGRRCSILVLHDKGGLHALDNRCPHLGFPLHRGSVEDGILTCHWHHARFDLESGGTFDLWADDVPTAKVEVRGDEVWVAADCGYPDEGGYWRTRLGDAMAHNLELVAGKAVLGLLDQRVANADILADAFLFGARNRDDWNTGSTILAALANVVPVLDEDDRYLALFKGICEVAGDCSGETPRRDRKPLAEAAPTRDALKGWLRHWSLVRHRNGAERTVLTAVASGAKPAELAELLIAAQTDRYYSDGGHSLDFINKAMECLDVIGWQHAEAILPTVVKTMVAARGEEEANAWRHPVDLVPLLEGAFAELPKLLKNGARRKLAWRDHRALAEAILGEEPEPIIAALKAAIAAGAQPTDLSRALAYAAALRVARFGTSNEFSDWNAAHHAFTYCNALHQALKRITSADHGPPDAHGDVVRGVFHGAMAVYLNRFLNVPPARLPEEEPAALAELPREAAALRQDLLDVMDRQQQVEPAARLVARYLGEGHDPAGIIATLGHALLREDAGFHMFQMYEAGVQQYREWAGEPEGAHILIAMTRFLAAHSPTQRAQLQTAMIARRLHRGASVHEGDGGDGVDEADAYSDQAAE